MTTTGAVAPDTGRRRTRQWWSATIVLLIIAAGCLTAGVIGGHDALTGTVPPRIVSPAAAGGIVGVPPAAPAPMAERSAPAELRIPAIGLTVSLSTLGLNPDRTVEVPTDFAQPGWYRFGPSPGQLGSAVILGHVDSYRGPAVFFRLRSLQAGDAVEVTLADGAVARFVVDTVATYPKDQFPAEQVYASHGSSALQLVTCGGEFDTHTRSYLSNVVAYTSLVSISPATAPAVDPADGD